MNRDAEVSLRGGFRASSGPGGVQLLWGKLVVGVLCHGQ